MISTINNLSVDIGIDFRIWLNLNGRRLRSIICFSFEQYLCSPFPDQPPNPNVADTEINQFCCVIRSRVFSDHESHSYIIGAEVDAAIPYYKGIIKFDT